MAAEEHGFDRRASDGNYKALSTRVTALEELVHNEVIPKMDRHTEIMAVIDARTDEMYAAFVTARNGVRMITGAGNAVMKVSDAIERRPKTTGLLVLGGVVCYSLATSGRVPEWFLSVIRLVAGS
jgi:hypothetical protein